MTAVVVILVILHVVPGVFWAGTTFALAREPLTFADLSLGRSQAIAAVIAVVAGLILWGTNQGPQAGAAQAVLGIGALCAVAAAGVQTAIAWPARQRLSRLTLLATPEAAADRQRAEVGQRAAAALLLVTVIAMVTARFF